MAENIFSLHNGIDVSLNSRSQATSIRPEHIHDYYEIYCLSSGTATHFVDNEILKLQEGDVVFVKKGVIHKTIYEAGKFTERLLICFDDDFVGDEYAAILDSLGEQKHIRLSALNRLDTETLLHKIHSEFCGQQEDSLKMCKNLLRELLILLHRYRRRTNIQKKTLNENESVIQASAKYIAENFSENLTLPALAVKFAMSPSYFSKTFKALTGFGVSEYITIIRIAEAEKLLKSECLSITEVASRCGFNDSNYFASVFKKKKGITPHKFAAINRSVSE